MERRRQRQLATLRELANRCTSPAGWDALWEVISLPVPALPGQPSRAATSLCPSVPGLHALPASTGRKWLRVGGSHVSRHKTRMTHRERGQHESWCPAEQTNIPFSPQSWVVVCFSFFLPVCACFFLPSASESPSATSACTSATINLMASRQKLLKLAAARRPQSSVRDVRFKTFGVSCAKTTRGESEDSEISQYMETVDTATEQALFFLCN